MTDVIPLDIPASQTGTAQVATPVYRYLMHQPDHSMRRVFFCESLLSILRRISNASPGSIAGNSTDFSRVSYCGVLLDDNNRKPICRLHFNSAQKCVGLFDAQKNEERIPIQSLDDIYQFADRLKAVIGYYDNPSESKNTATVESLANEEVQETEIKTDSY